MPKYDGQRQDAKVIKLCLRPTSEGFDWNPLKSYPSNRPCWCGSEIKAKKCCKRAIADCLSVESVKYLKENWFDIVTGALTLPSWKD